MCNGHTVPTGGRLVPFLTEGLHYNDDWESWCPRCELPLVEFCRSGDTDEPGWSIQLPLVDRFALRRAAMRLGVYEEEYLSTLVHCGLQEGGQACAQ